MNQLYEVMQSADVVIGIGARFSMGNPAGESSILININIDDFDLTRVQSNTIPLHGDARATIEAPLPYLIEAGAGSPITCRNGHGGPPAGCLLRHQASGAAVPDSGGDKQYHPGRCLHRIGRHPVRILRSHPLPSEPSQNLHGFRLLLQPRLRLPQRAGRESGGT